MVFHRFMCFFLPGRFKLVEVNRRSETKKKYAVRGISFNSERTPDNHYNSMSSIVLKVHYRCYTYNKNDS